MSFNIHKSAESKACAGRLASFSTLSFNWTARSSNPASAWSMNSRRMLAMTPWTFQLSPLEDREWLLGQPLKRMGQPIHLPALHKKTGLVQLPTAVLRQVGSCHLQKRAAPLHMVSLDFCDLGHLQWAPFYKNCSQCLPAATHRRDTVLGRRSAQGQQAQGTNQHFHH